MKCCLQLAEISLEKQDPTLCKNVIDIWDGYVIIF